MAFLRSIFGETPNYGKIAQSSANNRKGIINYGLNQINSVFDGGTAGSFLPATSFNRKSGEYYAFNKDGKLSPYWNASKGIFPGHGNKPGLLGDLTTAGGLDFVGNALFGGAFDSKTPRRDVAKKAFKKHELFTQGPEQTFEGFQPSFFAQREKAYNDFALPQVAEQYRLNKNALNFGLQNRGLGDSTIADQGRSQVERVSDTARQNVVDTGIEQSNQLRKSIEDARQESISQLYQTADPARALQGAISQASQLRAPSALQPIGDLFGNIARQYYINQALNNYRQGGQQSNYGGGGYDLSSALGPSTSRI